MKKLRYLAVMLAAAFVITGCSIIKVNPERDGQQVVAEVNGEKITKKQVYDYIGLSWDKKIEAWDLDSVKNQKEQGLEYLIADLVVKQKAKEQGMYNFTADEQKQIDDYVSTITKSTYDEALKKYQEAAKTDSSIKPEEKANADVDAYLATMGYTRDKVKEEKADSLAYEKLKKTITDKVTVTDDEVKSEYDKEVASQTAKYDAKPADAVADENNGGTIMYYPDGMFRVRQILIPLTDEQQKEISTLRSGTDADAATKADAKRTEYLKTIETKANEFLAKAKATGGDLTKLNQLIKDAGNNDPGMDSFAKGYLMSKDTTSYVKEFTTAALALTDVGKPSELVGTDYGYHIIWISEKITKGAVPFEDVKGTAKEAVTSSKQSTEWNNAVTGWIDQYETGKKLTRYTDRLHN